MPLTSSSQAIHRNVSSLVTIWHAPHAPDTCEALRLRPPTVGWSGMVWPGAVDNSGPTPPQQLQPRTGYWGVLHSALHCTALLWLWPGPPSLWMLRRGDRSLPPGDALHHRSTRPCSLPSHWHSGFFLRLSLAGWCGQPSLLTVVTPFKLGGEMGRAGEHRGWRGGGIWGI